MPIPVLRPYQQKLSDEIIAAIEAGETPIAQAATGAGKSHVLGAVAHHYLQQEIPITVLCHRREILLHLQRVLGEHTGLEPSLCMADEKPDWGHPLQLAMVPTLHRRLRSTPTDRGGLLFADEAHHCSSPSWSKVIEHLAPDHLAGVTATPVSCNRTPLSTTFDRLLIGPPSHALVADGHLAPARLIAAQHGINTRGLHIKAGDYITSELEQRARAVAGQIIPTWRKYNPDGLPTLVACCSISHSKEVAALYQQAGIRAQHIDGSTPVKERDRILSDFKNGNIVVLTFVSIIDEGLDIPEASVLQSLRPTKSLRLRRQLEGRIRRPHPGKADCTIIDHTSCWETLPLPDEAVRWRLDAPRETGATVVRAQGEKVVRKPSGEIVLEQVPATFREVTSRSRTQPSSSSVITRLEDPRRADWLLDGLASGRVKRWGVIEELKTDRHATLEHFRRVGEALGFKSVWAHHQLRGSVEMATPPAAREQLRIALALALQEALKAGTLTERATAPGMTQLVGRRDGRVVIACGLTPGQSLPLSWHRGAKKRLQRALEPALGPVQVLGLWAADEPLLAPGKAAVAALDW